MERPSRQLKSFSDLIRHAAEEVPRAPDLRFSIRHQLQRTSSAREQSWTILLINWADSLRIRVGFGMVFATLLMTSYWELSRPEPPPQPQIPSFIIDRFFEV